MLLKAVAAKDILKVRQLLNEGANTEIKDEKGFTAFHLASRGGEIKILRLLLMSGANIQATNKNGNTPLHSASYGGSVLAIRELIKSGADLKSKNNDGDTPLHSAAWNRQLLSVEELIKSGADLESKNNDGDTPLHLAAWQGHLPTINMLITSGSDPLSQSKDGKTALDLAKEKEHSSAFEILDSYVQKQEIPLLLNAQLHIETAYLRIKNFKEKVIEKAPDLRKILSDYQTYNVTDYEVDRVLRTLDGITKDNSCLDVVTPIDSATIMLPSNLPLYSLTVFAILPSFLSKDINIRPNSLLQENDIVSRICFALEIGIIFPNIHIINTDHAGLENYIKKADLVVFTGKPSNSGKILKVMKESSLLVINGAGHNPVVITEDADLDKAVEGCLLLKSFNGDQDCAGPDAILVHHALAEEFIKKFKTSFSTLKTGKFTDEDNIIGPIKRFTELQKFANIFHTHKGDIISGGVIYFKDGIVSPTIIVRGIERYPNYKEVFGPVAFIHPYKNDEDLSYYFQGKNGEYMANRMYVTVYGNSEYLSKRDDSVAPGMPGNVGIIIHNETIHEIEIGYKPYGGYSFGASGIIKKTPHSIQRVAMPILIPKIIVDYIINGNEIPTVSKQFDSISELKSPSTIREGIDLIIEDFQELAKEVFGKNLAFGFVFGSAVKGALKICGPDQDDLDTFICLYKEDLAAKAEYIKRLSILHDKYKLKIDETFPAEIMTVENLTTVIEHLEGINICVDKLIQGEEFDQIFWVHAITGKKAGFLGNGKIMSNLIKASYSYIYEWRDKIVEQLKVRDTVPEYLHQRFSGLSKEEIVNKLLKLSPHLVVHLGLNYDESTHKSTEIGITTNQISIINKLPTPNTQEEAYEEKESEYNLNLHVAGNSDSTHNESSLLGEENGEGVIKFCDHL